MTTTEETPISGAAAGTREFSVMLRMLIVEGDGAEDALEQLAIDVLEAIEDDPATAAIAVATACQFHPPAVEVDFDVVAKSLSEVHRQIGEVIKAIELRMPIEIIDGWSETAAPAGREPVAA